MLTKKTKILKQHHEQTMAAMAMVRLSFFQVVINTDLSQYSSTKKKKKNTVPSIQILANPPPLNVLVARLYQQNKNCFEGLVRTATGVSWREFCSEKF
jgi:hypothetical protein